MWRLANNISPVLFRKADWHGLEGYGAFTKWKALKRYKLRTRRSKERLTFQASNLFDLVTFYNRHSVSLFTCGAGGSASHCFWFVQPG